MLSFCPTFGTTDSPTNAPSTCIRSGRRAPTNSNVAKRRGRAPIALGTHTSQTPSSASYQRTMFERIIELEAGGHWDVIEARSIVEDAATTCDCELAVRALYAFEEAGFYASRALSTCVFTLLTSSGQSSECLGLLERLYEPFIVRNGIRVMLSSDIILKRRPNARMVTVAANCAARMLRPDMATAMVAAMKRAGDIPNPHVYSVLLKAYGKAGLVSDIDKIFKEARAESCTDIAFYNAAVDAYMRCGRQDFALAAMKAAEEDSFSLGSRTFNPLLREYARVGNVDDAFALVADMKRRGIAPSPVTINTLMQAAVRGGRLDIAQRILGQTISQGPWTQHKLIAYTTLVSGLAVDGQFGEATKMLSQMASQLGPDDAMGGGEIAGGSAHDGAAALSMPLAALISALLNKGEVVKAWELFRGMQEAITLAPDVYRALIRGLARRPNAGSVYAAERVLSEMMRIFWREGRPTSRARGRFSLPYELSIAHNAVMDGLVRIGEPSRAEGVLRLMQRQGISANAISYTSVLHGYARRSDVTNAERIHEEMLADGVRADRVTLNVLLGCYVRAGNLQATEKLFGKMLTEGGETTPNVTSYSALIALYTREGYVDSAWQAYEQLKRKGMQPGDRLVDRMLSLFVGVRNNRKLVKKIGSMTRAEWLEKTKLDLVRDMNECSQVRKAIGDRWERAKASFLQ